VPKTSLDDLFPPAPPHTRHSSIHTPSGIAIDATHRHVSKSAREEIPTKWAGIYALELHGLKIAEIAQSLSMSQSGIHRITTDARYIAYREAHLTAIDAEFVNMKPLAFAALKSGLNSADENTALRASEQWFKGAGFGGFNKDPAPTRHTTAEDVAAALIAGMNVNVQVNVNTAAEGGGSDISSADIADGVE
jgi:hypothetical protein